MIEVDKLEKSYGFARALKGISFRVQKGEVIGFLGPNGAGKSTTMKILTGYLLPSGGRATVDGFDVVENGKGGALRVKLKYGPRGERVLNTVKRQSKPGRRVYSTVEELPRPLQGLGIAIVSTSKGVLSDRKCRDQRVGGELLCIVE